MSIQGRTATPHRPLAAFAAAAVAAISTLVALPAVATSAPTAEAGLSSANWAVATASPFQTGSRDAQSASQSIALVEDAAGNLTVHPGNQIPRSAARVVATDATDHRVHLTSLPTIDESSGLAADKYRNRQWALDVLEAEATWEHALGEEQIIAVVDSGVESSHPDLQNQLVPGYSPINLDPGSDVLGHGTHVAGVIAAASGNSQGVAAIAPNAKIMPVRAMADDGSGFTSHVADGIIWAVDNGATVVNLSLAGTEESAVLTAAISYAVSKDVVVVAASGNEFAAGNPKMYPASNPQVITVGSVDKDLSHSSFSSSGPWVDVVAPGADVLSTIPGNDYGFGWGTSMAAPHVSGAIALMLSSNQAPQPSQVRDILAASSQDLGITGFDDNFGHGLLDTCYILRGLDSSNPTGWDAPDSRTCLAPTDGDNANPADEVETENDPTAQADSDTAPQSVASDRPFFSRG